MANLVQTDTYIFVTMIAVVVIAATCVVVVYHAVKLLQELRKIIRSVQNEVDRLAAKRQALAVSTRTMTKVLSRIINKLFFAPRK